MSLSVVPVLQSQQSKYADRIADTRAKIQRYEKAYESLRVFKEVVERSQGEFNAINTAKDGVLSNVEAVKKNSRTAQRYHSGMKEILAGVGSKIIGVVYITLLSSITVKMHSYLNSIDHCEDDIASYEKKIKEIDQQIETVQKAEEVISTVTGGGG